jgi:hypothetical protein
LADALSHTAAEQDTWWQTATLGSECVTISSVDDAAVHVRAVEAFHSDKRLVALCLSVSPTGGAELALWIGCCLAVLGSLMGLSRLLPAVRGRA